MNDECRRSSAVLAVLALLVLLAPLVGCGREAPPPPPPNPAHLGFFQPLPAAMESADNPLTQEKIDLGRMLYYETRLSAANDISCNTCHALDHFGVDGKPTSPGHEGQLGARNSPTVYNAALHIAQFWDGRAADVEEQAKGPILNPVEMALPNEERVVEILSGIPGYVEAFAKAFPGQEQPVTFDNVALAIGAFERKLVTPGRFDAYLAGDGSALSPQERRGLEAFIEVGCTTCHIGPDVGGGMYQKLGLVKEWPTKDLGRAESTGNDAEKYFFKVPSLRNVTMTGPWLHDGSVDSLETMVKQMAEFQLGKQLKPDEVLDIMAFLEALSGEIPTEYIAEPQLPE